MYFETFMLTIVFKNAKLNVEKKKVSKILGWSEKGKQTSFLGLTMKCVILAPYEEIRRKVWSRMCEHLQRAFL